MRTLNFYEIGVDPLPHDGSTIHLFDKTTSFNMFEMHTSISGTVQYMYADFGDTLEEAVSKSIGICIDREEYNEDWDLVGITINLDTARNVYTLRRGVIWCYEHEYLAMLDDSIFPFQCSESFDCAVNNKIIIIKKSEKKEVNPVLLQSITEIDSVVNNTYTVQYNNKNFIVRFVEVNGITKFREYSVYE